MTPTKLAEAVEHLKCRVGDGDFHERDAKNIQTLIEAAQQANYHHTHEIHEGNCITCHSMVDRKDVEILVKALEYCAQDPAQMHQLQNAQFVVARNALVEYRKGRGE